MDQTDSSSLSLTSLNKDDTRMQSVSLSPSSILCIRRRSPEDRLCLRGKRRIREVKRGLDLEGNLISPEDTVDIDYQGMATVYLSITYDGYDECHGRDERRGEKK